MWDWFFKIFPFFKDNSTEQFKAVTNEVWRITEEYKSRDKENKDRIKELQDLRGQEIIDQEELEVFIEREIEYHKQLIQLIQENRDLKEYILFLKKLLKYPDDS